MIKRIITAIVFMLLPLSAWSGPSDFNITTGGLPSMTGQSGKVLTNNGTVASWGTGGTGDVTGPASSVSGNFPSFNGAGGKTLQDSGYSASSFKTLTSAALPSGSTPSLASYDAYTDSQTSDLVSPPIVSAVGTKRIIFFTAIRAVRFDTSTTLKGNNSASWTTAAGAWMELNSDGTYWRCAIHGAD